MYVVQKQIMTKQVLTDKETVKVENVLNRNT